MKSTSAPVSVFRYNSNDTPMKLADIAFALSARLSSLLLALAAASSLSAGVAHTYDAQVALDVQQMQQTIQAKGWQFQVGVNPAMQ